MNQGPGSGGRTLGPEASARAQFSPCTRAHMLGGYPGHTGKAKGLSQGGSGVIKGKCPPRPLALRPTQAPRGRRPRPPHLW